MLHGAYELYQEGGGSKGAGACDVSSACHWAVNQASANNIGRMWGGAYSVAPSGIYVPPESDIRKPEELAGVEIAVGYHSGSHFTTIQALEVFLAPEHIKLRFIGRPMARLDAALDRSVSAVSAWGMAQNVLEQQEFRRVVDTTFMVGFLFPSEVDEADIEKFMNALKRAQMALDLHPERYKHYYLKELPERFLDTVDVKRFGSGERIVFLPYSEQMYRERNLSCAFRLSTLPDHEQIEEALAARGYVAHNPNLVTVRSSTLAPAGDVTVLSLDLVGHGFPDRSRE